MTTEEIEYIEPTQEHVGQQVEVRRGGATAYRVRKLLSVLPSEIKHRFVCQDSADPRSVSLWEYARIRRPLTYAERQARCGLKVGDRVRFVRMWGTEESGTILRFVDSMRGDIGSVCTIKSITNYSMCVGCRGFDYHVPYFVLEKVETQYREIQCDIGAKVVRINLNNKPTEYILHNIFADSNGCKFGVVKDLAGHWDVIELCDLRIEVK